MNSDAKTRIDDDIAKVLAKVSNPLRNHLTNQKIRPVPLADNFATIQVVTLLPNTPDMKPKLQSFFGIFCPAQVNYVSIALMLSRFFLQMAVGLLDFLTQIMLWKLPKC